MIEQALRLEAEMSSADLLGSLADLEKKTVDFANKYHDVLTLEEKSDLYCSLIDINSVELSFQNLLEDIHEENQV